MQSLINTLNGLLQSGMGHLTGFSWGPSAVVTLCLSRGSMTALWYVDSLSVESSIEL
jgi:hypothetical protein